MMKYSIFIGSLSGCNIALDIETNILVDKGTKALKKTLEFLD